MDDGWMMFEGKVSLVCGCDLWCFVGRQMWCLYSYNK